MNTSISFKHEFHLSVANQQCCGCCFAYASTEAIACAWARKEGREPERLSVQLLVDHLPILEPHWDYDEYVPDAMGCYPGHVEDVYLFAETHGLVWDIQYPYRECRRHVGHIGPLEIELHGLPRIKIKGYIALGRSPTFPELVRIFRKTPMTGNVIVYPSFRDFKGNDIYQGPTAQEKEAEAQEAIAIEAEGKKRVVVGHTITEE